MKTLLLILFPFLLAAQDSTITVDISSQAPSSGGISRYYYVTSAVLYGITAGISEGYRVETEHMGKINLSKDDLNSKAKMWRFASVPFIVGIGVSVALHSELDFWKTTKGLYTSAVLNWIFHDIAYNMTRKLDPFRKAQSPALTEVQFPVKLLFLGGAVLWEILAD